MEAGSHRNPNSNDQNAHRRSINGRRGARRNALLAVVVAFSLAVSACGSGSTKGTGSTAATNGSNGSSGSSSSGASSNSLLQYSQCMRANGVTNFPDPGGGGSVSISGVDVNSASFKSAQQACQRYLPGSSATPAQQAQNQAQMLKFAQCMRSHGVSSFSDPQVANGGSGANSGSASQNFDPNSPTFKAAQQACKQYQPGGVGIASGS
jgi:hypothetical protein